MGTFVSFEMQENGIAIVTLNRPEAANALSRALLLELGNLFARNQIPKRGACRHFDRSRGQGVLRRRRFERAGRNE